MDASDQPYSKSRFEAAAKTMGAFLRSLGFHAAKVAFVPVCGRGGDNLVAPSANMGWYKGPTLLEALDDLEALKPPAEPQPLRFTLQVGGGGRMPTEASGVEEGRQREGAAGVEEGRQRGSSRSGGGPTESEHQEWRRADREGASGVEEGRQRGSSRCGGGPTEREQQVWRRAEREGAAGVVGRRTRRPEGWLVGQAGRNGCQMR
jgi:hypothetical protein